MQKSSINSAELSDTYVKATTTKFFGFVTENTEIWQFFINWQSKSSLHCFFALIFFIVKVLRQWRQIWEAMKQWNVNYGKKFNQWSNEAFNAGKEIEAMKRLTFHRIASLLHRFITLLPSFGIHWLFIHVKMAMHPEACGCVSACMRPCIHVKGVVSSVRAVPVNK